MNHPTDTNVASLLSDLVRAHLPRTPAPVPDRQRQGHQRDAEAAIDEWDEITVSMRPPLPAEGGTPATEPPAGASVVWTDEARRGRDVRTPTPQPVPRTPMPSPAALGSYLSQAAAAEACSVPAYQRLTLELALHGAPDDLVAGARHAAHDEAKHWWKMRGLALAQGHTAVRPPAAAGSARSLDELATTNVVMGCVNETFGAAVALWQSQRAADPEIRAAMSDIAKDELRHADLGWAVDAWARERMGVTALAARRAARDEACWALAKQLNDAHAPVAEWVGLPSAREAAQLLQAIDEALWAKAA